MCWIRNPDPISFGPTVSTAPESTVIKISSHSSVSCHEHNSPQLCLPRPLPLHSFPMLPTGACVFSSSMLIFRCPSAWYCASSCGFARFPRCLPRMPRTLPTILPLHDSLLGVLPSFLPIIVSAPARPFACARRLLRTWAEQNLAERP